MSKELEKKIQELEAEKAKLTEANQVLLNENQLVQTELAKAEHTVDAVLPVITVGKSKYTLIAPSFNYQGTLYTFAELKKNQELQQELVKKKSGILIPLK